MLRSLEQERAKYAWECINSVKGSDDKIKKSYFSYVARASSLILTNGLGSALVFFSSKKEEAYSMLYNHISNGIKNERGIPKEEDILRWIENTSSIKVFHATKIALALLNWLKRFAEAELKSMEKL